MEQLQQSETKSKDVEETFTQPKAPSAILTNVSVAATSVSEPTSLQTSQKGSSSAEAITLKPTTSKEESLEAEPLSQPQTSAPDQLKAPQTSIGKTFPPADRMIGKFVDWVSTLINLDIAN